MAMIVRPAQATDIPEVNTFDSFPCDRAREAAEGRMLVAEVAERIAGYASWLPSGFVGRDYITFVCVAPELRRRGVACELLRAIEARIARGRLFISTEENNEAMLTLLGREKWTLAGAVAGPNENGQAEVFFYKDLA